jgi:unsaturated rhamnogalacturonyl hydrolase
MRIESALGSTLCLATMAAICLVCEGCSSASSNPATQAANTGGSTSSQGTAGIAGRTSIGGTTGTGGTTNTGGVPQSGGAIGFGGSSNLGGTSSAGGMLATGGANGTGSGVSTGGATGGGGSSRTGGTNGTGGTRAGTGGSAFGGAAIGGAAIGGAATGGTALGGAATGGAATGGRTATSTGGDTAAGGKSGTGGSGCATCVGGSTGVGGGTSTCPTVSDFDTWPSGQAPTDIGPLAVTSFKSHTGDAYSGAGYAWTFTYFGSLQFSKLTSDTTNNSYLISHFDCSQQGPDNSSTATVDDRAFGDLPLEIFLENQSAQCKTLGMARADTQWAKTNSDGITADARYWADDMYMITGLQVFGYRATKDLKYVNRSAQAMQIYFTKLQQSNGLFWHTQNSHAHWGRANGWVASGMTELLLELPAGTARDAVMAGYKKQMDGLLPLQITSGNDAGFWRQVLDLATTASYAERSCTAMFTYALVTGIKNGWLNDPKYVAAARNGWLALSKDAKGTGQLTNVCPGTGEASAGTLATQQKFYTDRTPGTNDMHGQAPLLWAATALLRKDCPGLR